jgi:ABC-type antimicrobial peptide transport system permease subunit
MLFGGTALVLATIGLYGLAARQVADRRQELGIRTVLGARPGDLMVLVMREAVVVAGLGVGIGLPLAFAASQATQGMLFGVSPFAPHVLLGGALALAATAVLATLPPARRAAIRNPISALRN